MTNAGEQLSAEELRDWLTQTDALSPSARLQIVAVGLALPVNVGTVLRVADAVKAERVWFVDSPNADTRKTRQAIRAASRHADQTRPHEFVTLDALLARRAELPPALVAVEITTRSRSLYQSALPEQVALVVGGERHGIPPAMLSACDFAVHLPMFGQLSSMNVAVSLAVTAYEWVRQHGGGGASIIPP